MSILYTMFHQFSTFYFKQNLGEKWASLMGIIHTQAISANHGRCVVFDHSNTTIVGSNPTEDTRCVSTIVRVCVVRCRQHLTIRLIPIQRVLPAAHNIHNFINNSEWKYTENLNHQGDRRKAISNITKFNQEYIYLKGQNLMTEFYINMNISNTESEFHTN